MTYNIAVKESEVSHSVRKTRKGTIRILAQCVDKETAEYISKLLSEQNIETFVFGFNKHMNLQAEYKIMWGSIVNISH